LKAAHYQTVAIRHAPSLDVTYVVNPKCACSTIQASLWLSSDAKIGTSTYAGQPHDWVASPFYSDAKTIRAKAKDISRADWFTVARNPYTRILSAYLDKISTFKRRDPLIWRLYVERYGVDRDAVPTFREFLDTISADDPESLDKHWRPQHLNVGIGCFSYDHVGRLEEMETTYAWLEERGIDQREEVRPHQTGANETIDLLKKEEIEIIQQLYDRDFTEFGYSRDPARRNSSGGLRTSQQYRRWW